MKKVVSMIDEKLKIIKSIDAGHHIQYPSDTRYIAFFAQMHSLHVRTRSSVVQNSFEREAKCVRMSSQTRSDKKPNAFE